jgi:stage V sporulation protein R
MDRFLNPPEYLEAQRRRIGELASRRRRFPESPARDVLAFLLEYAPLEPWQQDVLSIVRDEAYYFAPQAMTKIMNEGWATYWHSKIMSRVLKEGEVVDFADHHSGTLASRPGVLNPYKLGVELWRSIEERWDTGRHGREYDECDDLRRRREWDTREGRGLEKIFEVRRIYNDLTFVDEFLTREFCEEQKLFAWKTDPETGKAVVSDRDFAAVRRALLDRLTHHGQPVIEVEDGNHRNRAELLLAHVHSGADLDLADARETLKAVHALWQRPVHLGTRVGGKGRLVGWDGEKFSEEETGG